MKRFVHDETVKNRYKDLYITCDSFDGKIYYFSCPLRNGNTLYLYLRLADMASPVAIQSSYFVNELNYFLLEEVSPAKQLVFNYEPTHYHGAGTEAKY